MCSQKIGIINAHYVHLMLVFPALMYKKEKNYIAKKCVVEQ